VLHFAYDTAGDNAFIGVETYNTDTVTLNNTKTISPGFVFRHNAMGVGMNWATASTITGVDNIGGGAGNATDFGLDSRSLLAIENITVLGVTYTGCQKILSQRSAAQMGGHQLNITWYCPNNVGMVKTIHTDSNSTPGNSRMLEFDPTQSTP